jgi:hypothetical protein
MNFHPAERLRVASRTRVPGSIGAGSRAEEQAPFTPGPLGRNDVAARTLAARAQTASPLLVHLDLDELAELNDPEEAKTGDVYRKGSVVHRDADRPSKILRIVREKFRALAERIRIELGTGTNADRFLKVRFLWSTDDEYLGVSAEASSRTKIGPFTPDPADRGKGVTGYVFEGALALQIERRLLGVTLDDVNNIFAAAIAHELGHNLGVEHSDSPGDLMFVYNDKPKSDREMWLSLAARNQLDFKGWQLKKMELVLDKR